MLGVPRQRKFMEIAYLTETAPRFIPLGALFSSPRPLTFFPALYHIRSPMRSASPGSMVFTPRYRRQHL